MPFIRVRDPETKHEFDVLDTDTRITAEQLVPVKSKQYPPAKRPRPAKHFVASKNVNSKPSETAENKEAHSG